jgi:hypothetical protein
MPRKFSVGDRVRFHHERTVSVVMMQLPERDGEFEYRIRSPDEPHERMAAIDDRVILVWAHNCRFPTDVSRT